MTGGENDPANSGTGGASGYAGRADGDERDDVSGSGMRSDVADRVDDDGHQNRRFVSRRRRPAPRAHGFWRFGYPVLIVAAGVAVLLLARAGGKAVLDSTTVRVEEEVRLGEGDPGFVEFLAPTPTLLAAHTHRGQLIGVSFMARNAVGDGGGIVLMSPELLVASPEENLEDGEFLNALYSQGGLDALEFAVERMLGLGFDEVIEVTAEAMAALIQRAEPLPYLLSDDLTEVGADGLQRVVFEAGRHELSAADAARIYSFRNPGEADVNRVERQRLLWESWLGVIGRADDLDSVTQSFPGGLWPYVRSLGGETSVVEVVPMSPVAVDPKSPPFYVLGDEGWSWLSERALELVPWPHQPKSFWRPRVQLLDGIGDASAREFLLADAAVEVIRAGGVVTVMGNVDEFGVETTQFAYHRPELLSDELTNLMALELGVQMTYVELGESVPEVVDITVTVGRDRMAP